MTALKALNLIDVDGHPGPVLERLVKAEGDDRRRALRDVLERFYEPVFRLDLARATKAQFHEAFRSFGTREGVTAKCEAFFIQAAQDADIELSPFILSRRHGARRQAPSQRGRASSPVTRAPSGAVAQASQTVAPFAPIAPQVRTVAEMVLSKYPDFDPSWAPEVQAKWLEGMQKLYEGLSRGAVRDDE